MYGGAGPSERASTASAEMVGRAQESVVQVRSRGPRGRGAGAGVIWDQNGLVLTNQHVVAGRRRVAVVLRDGREFEAEVVKRGSDLDLALLRIENAPGYLHTVPVGDSDALRVGELVYAIGHPWGRLGAVTAGVVSGLGVAGGPRGRAGYVRSDVSLAPGNSGGPLLNARGEVVGVNAMVSGRLALSIPSNAASAWLAGAPRRRPRLGVGILPVEIPGSLRGPETPETGLMVAAIEAGSPASRAGLLVGDVLLGADGRTPDGPEALLDAITGAGDTVRLRVMRGGKISVVDVDLESPGRAA